MVKNWPNLEYVRRLEQGLCPIIFFFLCHLLWHSHLLLSKKKFFFSKVENKEKRWLDSLLLSCISNKPAHGSLDFLRKYNYLTKNWLGPRCFTVLVWNSHLWKFIIHEASFPIFFWNSHQELVTKTRSVDYSKSVLCWV